MKLNLKQELPLKTYFLIILTLYLGACVGGFIGTIINPDPIENIMSITSEKLKESGWKNYTLDQSIGIFVNNLKISLICFITWPIIIVALCDILFNGAILGGLTGVYTLQQGFIAIPVVIIAILPHGIIELPLFMLSSALALQIFHNAYLTIIKKIQINRLVKVFGLNCAIFAVIITPGLFIAAITETYVTPTILDGIMNLLNAMI